MELESASDSTESPFANVIIGDWNQAVTLSRQLSSEFVFRGQSNTTWQLETAFRRKALDYQLQTYEYRKAEQQMLSMFQRRSHHYIPDAPSIENEVEWLALMQHFGCPTRLLDFSFSFYVAAFFALSACKSECAVWAIKQSSLRRAIYPPVRRAVGAPTDEYADVELSRRFLGEKRPRKLVLQIQPRRMNERLSIQQGLFLFPCDLVSSFTSNLAATLGASTTAYESEQQSTTSHLDTTLRSFNVLKIVIPEALRIEALLDLERMNITRATLFPGLEGFAQSLESVFRSLR